MDERSIEALQASLADVCGHVNAQQARLVRVAEAALPGEAWKQIGVHSPSHWLAWQAGLSTGTAKKVLAVARRASLHPAVMAAFDAGELSLNQAALAMRAPGVDRHRDVFVGEGVDGVAVVDGGAPVPVHHRRRSRPPQRCRQQRQCRRPGTTATAA